MREYLASARSRSNMEAAGAEAFGDQVGADLLRGIDSGDGPSLRRAKWALASDAARRASIPILRATRAAHLVMNALADQRCPHCRGTRHAITAAGGYRPCMACNATGFFILGAPSWAVLHYQILHSALRHMGQHLRLTGGQLERRSSR